MRMLWNSSGIFSQDLRHCRFFRRSRLICESGTLHRLDHFHIHDQRHWLDEKRKWWNLYFEFRKSQGIREENLAGTLDVPRSWRRKEVVWNSSWNTWRIMTLWFYSHSNGGTIHRYWSSSISRVLVFWVVEFSKKKKKEWQRHHTLLMRMLQTPSSCSETLFL